MTTIKEKKQRKIMASNTFLSISNEKVAFLMDFLFTKHPFDEQNKSFKIPLFSLPQRKANLKIF